MRDILLKFTKTTRIFFQNGGARARRAGPGSAFVKPKIFPPKKIVFHFMTN